jgi:hypothetical protein
MTAPIPYPNPIYPRMFGPLAISPSSIFGTSLAIWLDAANASVLKQTVGGSAASANNDPVGQFLDLTKNATNLSQATAGKRPLLKPGALNGRNVIEFDGVDDALHSSAITVLAQPTTIFLVAKYTSAPGTNAIIVDGITSGNRQALYNATGFKIYAGTGIVGNIYGSDTNWNVWIAKFNGASSSLALNNGAAITANPGALGTDGVSLGNAYDDSGPAPVQVAEVAVISALASTTQTEAMKSYLNAKWAVY